MSPYKVGETVEVGNKKYEIVELQFDFDRLKVKDEDGNVAFVNLLTMGMLKE